MTSNSSETLAEYHEFLNGGIPSDVQTELETAIRRELGVSEVGGKKIVNMIPMLQQTLFQSFRQYREGSSSLAGYQHAKQPTTGVTNNRDPSIEFALDKPAYHDNGAPEGSNDEDNHPR